MHVFVLCVLCTFTSWTKPNQPITNWGYQLFTWSKFGKNEDRSFPNERPSKILAARLNFSRPWPTRRSNYSSARCHSVSGLHRFDRRPSFAVTPPTSHLTTYSWQSCEESDGSSFIWELGHLLFNCRDNLDQKHNCRQRSIKLFGLLLRLLFRNHTGTDKGLPTTA